MGAAYVVRLVILRKVDLRAAGLYHSAWTIGGLYVGFILRAMGADSILAFVLGGPRARSLQSRG